MIFENEVKYRNIRYERNFRFVISVSYSIYDLTGSKLEP